jgi:hypothetical protein
VFFGQAFIVRRHGGRKQFVDPGNLARGAGFQLDGLVELLQGLCIVLALEGFVEHVVQVGVLRKQPYGEAGRARGFRIAGCRQQPHENRVGRGVVRVLGGVRPVHANQLIGPAGAAVH